MTTGKPQGGRPAGCGRMGLVAVVAFVAGAVALAAVLMILGGPSVLDLVRNPTSPVLQTLQAPKIESRTSVSSEEASWMVYSMGVRKVGEEEETVIVAREGWERIEIDIAAENDGLPVGCCWLGNGAPGAKDAGLREQRALVRPGDERPGGALPSQPGA